MSGPRPSPAAELHDALAELARLYQFRDRDRICCHDVSVTQCYALETLVREGPATLGALAAALYLDKSTASRVVDALERKGYVRREPAPRDARALALAPTAAGRALYRKIRSDLVATAEEILGRFPPAVRQEAPRLIRQLAAAVAACCGPEAEACSPDTCR